MNDVIAAKFEKLGARMKMRSTQWNNCRRQNASNRRRSNARPKKRRGRWGPNRSSGCRQRRCSPPVRARARR